MFRRSVLAAALVLVVVVVPARAEGSLAFRSVTPSSPQSPAPTASPGAPPSGLPSGAGLVVLLVLLGGLLLVRARLGRRSRGDRS